jgi:hypothetical protein
MAYTGPSYDAETLDLMRIAFSAAWREALGQGVPRNDMKTSSFIWPRLSVPLSMPANAIQSA